MPYIHRFTDIPNCNSVAAIYVKNLLSVIYVISKQSVSCLTTALLVQVKIY